MKNVSPRVRAVAGACVVAVCVLAGSISLVLDNADPDVATAQDNSDLAWPLLRRSQAGRNPVAMGASQPQQVAGIPSLISGLEQRLELQPDDPKGWALLAQSYAFVGQSELAETALRRAVELGMSEADLRTRVESARRVPHAGSWIDQAIGG
jgi:cytochrome c-type biogenesis protein CcmH/NrfG